ncbi:MAG: DUF4115 domain-containing protein [Candidatus Omnitrophica bacterium]|nr:DUF4115 domain-containing protein [Candidatus Omnitrophota bacterium]
MESIGQRLKKIRLEKGLSLEEANKKTNIHLTILKAIEDDSMINLNPIYIQGFIKIYCKYLGVDPQAFVPEHKVTQNIAPKRIVKETSEKVAPALSKPPLKLPFKQIVTAIVIIILLVALFKLGKFIAVRAAKFSAKRPRAVLVTKDASRTEARKTNSSGQQAHSEKIPASGVIRLSIRAKDNCFIQVKCDGKTQFIGTLKKGRADSWKANEKIEFTLGNATAVEVEVNNRLISNLGRRGQTVKNITITKDGLTIPR